MDIYYLTKEQFAYIKNLLKKNYILYNKVSFNYRKGRIIIEISNDDIFLELFECIETQLQIYGFDVNDLPTEEGLMLEDLIDVFNDRRYKLTNNQFKYLKIKLNKENNNLLNQIYFCNETSNLCIKVPNDNILDDMCDWLLEKLQIHGFDENYEITAEGKILESLIDVFNH